MKLLVALYFRSRCAEVLRLVPADLAFLRAEIREGDGDGVAEALFTASPESVERVLQWGREEHKGKSIVGTARIRDLCDLQDLEGQRAAELFHRVTGAASRSVLNFNTAYRATWACEYCHQVSWEQVGPLKIKLSPRHELQYTRSQQWIASKRVAEVMARYQIGARPLANTEAFVQLLIEQECQVLPDAQSVGVGESACRGCGSRSFWRKDWVEGDLFDKTLTGITIFYHEQPLSLDAESCTSLQVSRGDIRFGWGGSELTQPVHVVGTLADVNEYRSRSDGAPCYFANADLIRELLELKVTGFGLRPVKLA